MLFKGKRGDKEIQIVFGLLILLIISIVVLNLFFKVIGKAPAALEGKITEQEKQQRWDNALNTCKTKCSAATNRDSAIEFCSQFVTIDMNGNSIFAEKASYGKWDFCESKLPCFVLLDADTDCPYKGSVCKDLLINNRKATYTNVFYSSDGKGGCGLATDSDNTDNNWIKTFGYDVAAP
ncbi:hypothetical protein HY640_04705 [Candidatus Woesearchaeota archaeon]|nr:hypothetical protein [Candidatus Woesearchaeota archaeon]